MEIFKKAETVRLRSYHDKYLLAEEDEDSVNQDRDGRSMNARWTVEIVEETNAIRLKSCFGKYLTASNIPMFLGMTGKRVTQTLPRRLDSSTEWEPIREGVQVRLKTRYGQYLRANGGLPPWRNSITHDIPHRTTTQDWILWDIDVLESRKKTAPPVTAPQVTTPPRAVSPAYRPRPPPPPPPELLTVKKDDHEESDSPTGFSLKSPRYRKTESNDKVRAPVKVDGRLIYYRIGGEDGNVDEGAKEELFCFKGMGLNELKQKLEEETGLSDISICSKNPLNGKLYPLRLHLPPNNTKMHVVLIPSSSKVYEAYAVSYDYSASTKCLVNPLKPQYGGGIITNPELNSGLSGWSAFGNATIATSISRGGNRFVVASHRTLPQDGVSQTLYLRRNHHYTLSAWIQVSDGEDVVRAIVESRQGFVHAGSVRAKSGCWSMLKGGLTIDISGPAILHFESNNTSIDIWVDNVSLQPFTQEEWQSTQLQSLGKVRKEKMQIKVVDKDGKPIPNATINLQQKKLGFPFGCAMNKNILGNQAYIDWFTQRFTVTTFEDELKWYSTEIFQGKETYEIADAMVQLCNQYEISVRGHNVLWEDPRYQPYWVYSLSPGKLKTAARKRLKSVMTRYKGQFIHWDVVNENLHFDFFESKLGQNLSSKFYKMAHAIDPSPILFMNDYNTMEDSRDSKTTPDKYLKELRRIQSFNKRIPMGIGLEGHWSTPVNLPYMRSVLDKLAATGLPIWLTEIDVESGGNQAGELEKILREVFSYPQVKGIVIWSALKQEGCYHMCLTDNSFKNLATGDVVDKLIREWGGLGTSLTGKTDGLGSFETSLFHGDYELQIYSQLHSLDSVITSISFTLDSGAPSFLEIMIY